MVNIKRTLIGTLGSLVLLLNFLIAEEKTNNKITLESKLQHVGDTEKKDWEPETNKTPIKTYTKTFNLDEIPKKADIVVYSVFAIVPGNEVIVNGEEVGDLSHKSEFWWGIDYIFHRRKIPPKIDRYDVSSYLKKGENTLEIKPAIHGKGKKQQYNDFVIGGIDLEEDN